MTTRIRTDSEPGADASVPVGGAVGRPVDRRDGHAKVTGAVRFSAEHHYPNLTFATLVHATVARGTITGIDTAAAAGVPGVVAVLTHLNAPRIRPVRKANIVRDLGPSVSGTSLDYLNTDQVFWDGQPIAVVVAETSAAANEAAPLVEVTYDLLPARVDFAAEQKNATPAKGDLTFAGQTKKGHAEAALAAADVSVDLRYTTPGLQHNAIEPHATVAVWDGDHLTVHDTTQAMDQSRRYLAWRFGVPASHVRVHAEFVGGGFGGKFAVWPGTVIAAMAAKAVGRPVRLALSRTAVSRATGGRTASTNRIALGATRDGRLTSLIQDSNTRTGSVGGLLEATSSPARHLYGAQNMLTRQNLVAMDLMPNTWLRAPGEAIGSFVLESAMDELAYELSMDPIALRLRNEPTTDPTGGKKFSQRMQREAFETGAERFGWADRNPEPRSMRDGEWLIGMGTATAYHPTLRLVADVKVRLSDDGSALVQCGFHEMGMGAATVQAQIAADALGIAYEKVQVEYGDSALPSGPMAGNSNQTATVATSVLAACAELTRKVTALARRTGTTGQEPAATLRAARRPFLEASVGSATRRGALGSQGRFLSTFLKDQRWSKAARGAQFCEVRVNADTGELRISRWLGMFDVGRVINPKTAASQLRGAVVMGIGMALSEQTLVDPRKGRTMSAGLDSYYVPVHADIPPIDVAWLDEPDKTMPLGIIGLGEVGMTGVAAAIANAVYHATGKRIRDLPITLDKLL
ncbi:xanthine dehydrogenase family protein molybdopterin-binding subunit [Streptomyces ipomoeae]|uniref:xanthine dehydrogenase family protein molybdopterin-binding subunit n=1 Tax=Streptomyces ipomoeae TaxID=103232 RepID=UPI00114754E7|nr:xanthine dehydrogenase family protein molybdopterin-binding subunit [Streptomyces ipomoeae]MDX2939259.1 xanthine dehydrogenase family protein molybdopterin-binding subunit [Streptomyces ipomoeae]TQE31830.1 xanthine dehydrogenase family protein molybdopterin-binding subunit [Streptomyces ipomoeae]